MDYKNFDVISRADRYLQQLKFIRSRASRFTTLPITDLAIPNIRTRNRSSDRWELGSTRSATAATSLKVSALKTALAARAVQAIPGTNIAKLTLP